MEPVITDVASGRGAVRGLIYTNLEVLIATILQGAPARAVMEALLVHACIAGSQVPSKAFKGDSLSPRLRCWSLWR
jgi:hypothetical protein